MDSTIRIGAALYDLTSEQRMGLSASEVRNIITNLRPVIEDEARAAVAAEREAAVEDVAAVKALFHGTSEGDAYARAVLDRAAEALRAGQVKRAGACDKPLDCGSGCALPPLHKGSCRCGADDGDGCPA